MPRAPAWLLAFVPACFDPARVGPDARPCTTDCGGSSTAEGTSTSMAIPDLGAHDSSSSTETAEPDTSSTGALDSSTGTGAAESTAAALAGFLEPCVAGTDCESGSCMAGLCSQVCWSQTEGETPCPAAPAIAPDVEIVCGRLPDPSCEGCFDCGQYCITRCASDAECPQGSACMMDPCAGFGGSGPYCAPVGG